MKHIYIIISLVTLLFNTGVLAQTTHEVKSPNGKIKVTISTNPQLEYSIAHEGDVILNNSPISLTLDNGQVWGANDKLKNSNTKSYNKIIESSVYKRSVIKDVYNETILSYRKGYDVVFRIYDEGVAYRFVPKNNKNFIVVEEQAQFNFPSDQNSHIAYVAQHTETLESQFFNSFENTYSENKLSEWNKNLLAFLPLLTQHASGKKVVITEADLISYPGMYLYNGTEANSLVAKFARVPKIVEPGGHNMFQELVREREKFIAKCEARATLPWRIIVIAENDYELLDNDMVYKLSTPSTGDFSWVKPGKVAWEWWHASNLYNVDFKTGINNETYKYYIDFASKNNIEYIILDEGWAVNLAADLRQVVKEIDLEELVEYGRERNVGLILWAGYYAIKRDMENLCKHFSDMGVKGFKVDFMDRDDQAMVKFHYDLAEIASRHNLLIDYHGTYKPTGLQRTFPNVLNFEGVYGLENMKVTDRDLVTYDVTMPFIRMLAGPVDYTQGAMRNAVRSNFRDVYSEPMSQGTRCRQLAEYIIFESPLNMMCDNPQDYTREQECTDFITDIPTTWDETVALNGELGKYISLARRKGDVWYIGSITNWDRRDLTLDLSFLGTGSYKAEVFKDGINADRSARDYKKQIVDVPSNKKLTINLASGGGCALKLSRK